MLKWGWGKGAFMTLRKIDHTKVIIDEIYKIYLLLHSSDLSSRAEMFAKFAKKKFVEFARKKGRVHA